MSNGPQFNGLFQSNLDSWFGGSDVEETVPAALIRAVSLDETPNFPECDYDKNPTNLFKAIESRKWETVEHFLLSGSWRREYHPSKELTTPQVCTWVTKYETSIDGNDEYGRWTQLPIHAALTFGAPDRVIKLLIKICPGSARCADDQRMVPLHLAFRHGASDESIGTLLDVFPEAIGVSDFEGHTPVECALDGPHSRRSEIIQAIIDRKKDTWQKKEAKLQAKQMKQKEKLSKLSHSLKNNVEEVADLSVAVDLIKLREENAKKVLLTLVSEVKDINGWYKKQEKVATKEEIVEDLSTKLASLQLVAEELVAESERQSNSPSPQHQKQALFGTLTNVGTTLTDAEDNESTSALSAVSRISSYGKYVRMNHHIEFVGSQDPIGDLKTIGSGLSFVRGKSNQPPSLSRPTSSDSAENQRSSSEKSVGDNATKESGSLLDGNELNSSCHRPDRSGSIPPADADTRLPLKSSRSIDSQAKSVAECGIEVAVAPFQAVTPRKSAARPTGSKRSEKQNEVTASKSAASATKSATPPPKRVAPSVLASIRKAKSPEEVLTTQSGNEPSNDALSQTSLGSEPNVSEATENVLSNVALTSASRNQTKSASAPRQDKKPITFATDADVECEKDGIEQPVGETLAISLVPVASASEISSPSRPKPKHSSFLRSLKKVSKTLSAKKLFARKDAAGNTENRPISSSPCCEVHDQSSNAEVSSVGIEQTYSKTEMMLAQPRVSDLDVSVPEKESSGISRNSASGHEHYSTESATKKDDLSAESTACSDSAGPESATSKSLSNQGHGDLDNFALQLPIKENSSERKGPADANELVETSCKDTADERTIDSSDAVVRAESLDESDETSQVSDSDMVSFDNAEIPDDASCEELFTSPAVLRSSAPEEPEAIPEKEIIAEKECLELPASISDQKSLVKDLETQCGAEEDVDLVVHNCSTQDSNAESKEEESVHKNATHDSDSKSDEESPADFSRELQIDASRDSSTDDSTSSSEEESSTASTRSGSCYDVVVTTTKSTKVENENHVDFAEGRLVLPLQEDPAVLGPQDEEDPAVLGPQDGEDPVALSPQEEEEEENEPEDEEEEEREEEESLVKTSEFTASLRVGCDGAVEIALPGEESVSDEDSIEPADDETKTPAKPETRGSLRTTFKKIASKKAMRRPASQATKPLGEKTETGATEKPNKHSNKNVFKSFMKKGGRKRVLPM